MRQLQFQVLCINDQWRVCFVWRDGHAWEVEIVDYLERMDFSDLARDGKLPPVTPGEILLEEFLKPMGISQYRLAKEIGVPQRRIGEIVASKRAITVDTGLRLSRFFGMNDGCWIGLQTNYDTAREKVALAEVLSRIHRFEPAASPQKVKMSNLKPSKLTLRGYKGFVPM